MALLRPAKDLKPADVSGRVIIVPAMNYPAVRAARRTSPIDAGNLNRNFPGRPDGSVTEKTADYFQRFLLPLADIVLDFHSGGRTLDFLPFAAAHELADKEQESRCVAAMEAFNAPYSMKLLEFDAVGMYDTAAERAARHARRRFLRHLDQRGRDRDVPRSRRRGRGRPAGGQDPSGRSHRCGARGLSRPDE